MTDFIASAAGEFAKLKIQNVEVAGNTQVKISAKSHLHKLVKQPRSVFNHHALMPVHRVCRSEFVPVK